jgi:hypothetical protein
MRIRSIAVLLSLSLIIVLGGVFAQGRAAAADPDPQRVALVIGNGAYKDSPLANPVNDANDIASALRNFGFKVILINNADTRSMRQAIRDFGMELRRAQVGLFYFAGHGVQVKGNNYLVPVGADIETEADAEDLSVDANYVLRTMEDAKVMMSVVILDACRNNPFARSFRSISTGLAQMSAATGSLIAFATAPGSTAADGAGRNGIYTKNLLESLRQPDTDILKVFQRTRAAVVRETGGKQTPWESTSLVGDFYFATTARPAGTIARPTDYPQPKMQSDQTVIATNRPANGPERQKGAPAANGIAGNWTADVTYDWGNPRVRYIEKFSFTMMGDSVLGYASFLEGKRGLAEGKIDGNKLTFITRSQSQLGDGKTVTDTHRYIGIVAENEIKFIMQTESQTSDHQPIEFTARKAGKE